MTIFSKNRLQNNPSPRLQILLEESEQTSSQVPEPAGGIRTNFKSDSQSLLEEFPSQLLGQVVANYTYEGGAVFL